MRWANGKTKKRREKWREVDSRERRINLRRVFLNFSSSLFHSPLFRFESENEGRSICQNFRVIPPMATRASFVLIFNPSLPLFAR